MDRRLVPLQLGEGWELLGPALPSSDDILGDSCSIKAPNVTGVPPLDPSAKQGGTLSLRKRRVLPQAGCEPACMETVWQRPRLAERLCLTCKCRLCAMCSPPENIWWSPTSGRLHTITTRTQPRFTFAYNPLGERSGARTVAPNATTWPTPADRIAHANRPASHCRP